MLGLDFSKNDNFSKATFPPPTTKMLRFETFKNIGYNSLDVILFIFHIINSLFLQFNKNKYYYLVLCKYIKSYYLLLDNNT